MTNKAKFCPHYPRVAWSSPIPATGVRLFTRMRCKRWTCAYCADIEARRWRAHLLDGINKITHENGRWFFVTLTAPNYKREPDASFRRVHGAWRKFTLMWRDYHRRLGLPYPEYAMTYEAHKDGAIHCHAIVMSMLRLDYMVNINHNKRYKKNRKNVFDRPSFKERMTWRVNDLAAKFGAGHQAKIIECHNANAGKVASYITKYISKTIQQDLLLPENARRISTSRGFGTFGAVNNVDNNELKWESANQLEIDTYMKIKRDCNELYDMQLGINLNAGKFEFGKWYPYHSERDLT